MGNPRYANGHRRRQLRKRILAEEYYCHICHGAVDKTLKVDSDGKPHPLSAEVDEIIPISLGGSPLDRNNCRLAHRICNQQKGNKILPTKPEPVEVPYPLSRGW